MDDTPEKPIEPGEANLEKPFQFTIGQLMIVTAAVAVFFAIVTQLSLVVGVFFAAAYLYLLFLRLVHWLTRDQKFYDRGMSLYRKGDYDKAIVEYTKVIRLNPEFAGAYVNRAAAWNNKGEYDKVIADCNEAIQLNPNYSIAYYNRGVAWGIKGERVKAEADVKKAKEIWLFP